MSNVSNDPSSTPKFLQPQLSDADANKLALTKHSEGSIRTQGETLASESVGTSQTKERAKDLQQATQQRKLQNPQFPPGSQEAATPTEIASHLNSTAFTVLAQPQEDGDGESFGDSPSSSSETSDTDTSIDASTQPQRRAAPSQTQSKIQSLPNEAPDADPSTQPQRRALPGQTQSTTQSLQSEVWGVSYAAALTMILMKVAAQEAVLAQMTNRLIVNQMKQEFQLALNQSSLDMQAASQTRSGAMASAALQIAGGAASIGMGLYGASQSMKAQNADKLAENADSNPTGTISEEDAMKADTDAAAKAKADAAQKKARENPDSTEGENPDSTEMEGMKPKQSALVDVQEANPKSRADPETPRTSNDYLNPNARPTTVEAKESEPPSPLVKDATTDPKTGVKLDKDGKSIDPSKGKTIPKRPEGLKATADPYNDMMFWNAMAQGTTSILQGVGQAVKAQYDYQAAQYNADSQVVNTLKGQVGRIIQEEQKSFDGMLQQISTLLQTLQQMYQMLGQAMTNLINTKG